MGYDLYFWKYEPGVSLDHQKVCERLADGLRVDGLEDLPVNEMLALTNSAFSDWERLDEVTFDGGSRGAFQLYTTSQLFAVNCHGVAGEDMNRFIDIAANFGCPLYDPQVDKRFESG